MTITHNNRIEDMLQELFIQRKFGIFVHWGLYSILGGRWQGKTSPYIAEWIMKREAIPVREYVKLADQFNPDKFDAEEFVGRVAAGGAKYLVVTAKHHDGFALYHSDVSDYNVVDATPYGRDIIAEFAEQCRRFDLMFGIYYSHDQDWHHPHGHGNDWDFDENKKNFDIYFREKALPQVQELLTNYGDIGLVWFDTPFSISRENSEELVDFVHDIQPTCLVSSRVGHGLGDYLELCDNGLPSVVLNEYWETPLTMNHSWGYKIDDNNWKSSNTLLRYLISIIGKGGNGLLNIGPMADGSIPAESVAILNDIGTWMKHNGQAVFGARPNPFGADSTWGTATCRENKLFLHIFDTTCRRITLRGLRNQVKDVRLGDQLISYRQENTSVDKLTLTIPPDFHSDLPFMLSIEVEGQVTIDNTIAQQGDDNVILEASQANLVAETPQIEIDHTGVAQNWLYENERMRWRFAIDQPNHFDVAIVTVGLREDGDPATPIVWQGGHEVSITLDGATLKGRIEKHDETENPLNSCFPFYITKLGKIALERPGTYEIELKADSIFKQDPNPTGFTLKAIHLNSAPAS